MNKRKVPKIRFKGFYDDWEQRKLGEVIRLNGRIGFRGYTEKDIVSKDDGGVLTFSPTNIVDNKLTTNCKNTYITRFKYDESPEIKIHNGDILFVKTGSTLGKSALVTGLSEDATLNPQVVVMRTNNLNAEFLAAMLVTNAIISQVNSAKIGGAVPTLTETKIKDFDVAIPVFEAEKEQIGQFFSRLDHLITLHQKKCFEWKKSGFSSASISWEQRKLSEVVKEVKRTDETSEAPVMMITAENGFINQSERYSTNNAGQSLKKYILLEKGELAYNHGASKLRPFGSCFALISKEKARIPFVYHCFSSELENAEFLSLTLNGKPVERQLRRIVSSGARMDGLLNISFEEYTAIPISLPQKAEQDRIADYFRSLDHLITLHQRKLERLKRLKNSLINRCFTGEKITMSKLILYHGSPNRVIVPKFGFGEDRHDYGRGFYLTENLELAKEWAVCRPDETNGWVHKYELEMDGLNILDFQKYDVLSWLAELMKHRDAADSRRYKMLAQKFIEKYGIDTCGYDVITGWRANASYFYIAKEFVRDNIDIEILEELLSLGGLGIQFCIKSERAFAQLSEVEQDIMSVDYSEFNDRYNERDINARNKMRALVDSDANKVTHVFSTLFER